MNKCSGDSHSHWKTNTNTLPSVFCTLLWHSKFIKITKLLWTTVVHWRLWSYKLWKGMTNRRHNKTYHHQLKWKCQVCWALVVKLPIYKVILTLPTQHPVEAVLSWQMCGHPAVAVLTLPTMWTSTGSCSYLTNVWGSSGSCSYLTTVWASSRSCSYLATYVDTQWKLFLPDKCVQIQEQLLSPCQTCGDPVVAALGNKFTAKPLAPLIVPGFVVVRLVPSVNTVMAIRTNLPSSLLLFTAYLCAVF